MANLVLSVSSDTLKENAGSVYGYPALYKIIDGILSDKTVMEILEDLRPRDVAESDWGKSDLAESIQRLLLKLGVKHPGQTRLLEDRWSLSKVVTRGGDTEVVELFGWSLNQWKLCVSRLIDDDTTTRSEIIDERTYDDYASAVDDWLWATR